MLLTREQLQERLITLHEASLKLVKDASLDHLLERIADVAGEQAGARYAALGVLGDDGKLVKFIAIGMTESEIQRVAHPPVGRGLSGGLMNTEVPLGAGHLGSSELCRLPNSSPPYGLISGSAHPGWGKAVGPDLSDG